MSGNEDGWHQPLRHTRAKDLDIETSQTPGMTRFAAISGSRSFSEGIWMGETHVVSGSRSANHHHGESETAIFVLRGNPVFVFFDNGEEQRIETAPGDYVYVPPFAPHREENPGDKGAVVILARTSQEAIVVNLDSHPG